MWLCHTSIVVGYIILFVQNNINNKLTMSSPWQGKSMDEDIMVAIIDWSLEIGSIV